MDALARRAAEHFTEMTEEMDEEVVLEIVRTLETVACSDEPYAQGDGSLEEVWLHQTAAG